MLFFLLLYVLVSQSNSLCSGPKTFDSMMAMIQRVDVASVNVVFGRLPVSPSTWLQHFASGSEQIAADATIGARRRRLLIVAHDQPATREQCAASLAVRSVLALSRALERAFEIEFIDCIPARRYSAECDVCLVFFD